MFGYSIFGKRARLSSRFLALSLGSLCASLTSGTLASQNLPPADKPTVSSILERAMTIVRSIDDGSGRYRLEHDQALLAITVARARCGEIDAALSILARTETEFKAGTAEIIATEQARAGDIAGACDTIRKYVRPEFRDGRLRHIAEVLSKNLDCAGVRRVAVEIKDPIFRSHALRFAANALAGQGNFGAAEDIVATIPVPADRAEALSELAKIVYEHGDRPKAAALLKRALQAAEEARSDARKGFPYEKVANVMFITGDRTGARAALNMGLNAVMKIKDREARDNATGCVIYGFSEIGDFERAFVLGRTKLEGDWTEAVYSGIASIAASSGDQKTFQLALSKIKNKKAHDSTLWSAALVQAEHHQFTEAGRTASLIGNISNKDGAFEFIAGMQAKTGDIISAQENLAKVDSVYFRVDARRAICNSLVNKGDVEGAVTYALQAKEPYEQVCGLAGVAEGMIESRKKPVKSLAKR